MDGKVKPVGDLVGPLRPAPAAPSAKPAPGRQAASPVTAEAKGVPSETMAVTTALLMFAAAAAVVLILLRRRVPQ
jgi:hypothetical protein